MSEQQKSDEPKSFAPSFQPDATEHAPSREELEFRHAVIESLHRPDQSQRQQLEPHQTFDMTPDRALYRGPGGTLYGVVEMGPLDSGGARGIVMREGDR